MRLAVGALASMVWMLSALTACSREPQELTQVVVAVNAEPRVAERLGALRVRVYRADATDQRAPDREQLIALRSSDAGRGIALPLSFGIQQTHVDEFVLVVEGCTDSASCDQAFVQHKVFVRFQRHLTVQVSIVLAAACATPAALCEGLQQTCDATASAAATRSPCGPVAVAITNVVQPGHESLPMLPSLPAETSVLDAGLDASSDGRPQLDAVVPVPDGSTEVLPATCPGDNSCRQDVYPCLPGNGTSYVCRGQFADWPMPDSSRDGGVPQSYDLDSVEGVARDRVTGLSWQRKTPNSYPGCTGRQSAPGDLCDFQEAVAYCEGLTLGGLHWRVPTKIELESLLDFRLEVQTLDPAIFFYTSLRSAYWTSSPLTHPDLAERRYTVEFLERFSGFSPTDVPLAVRCVHSEDQGQRAEPSRYLARPVEGSIGDAYTGLLWYPPLLCEPGLTYASAEDFCARLPARMRVPTAKELLTLVDPTRPPPAVDPVFADTPETGWLWTASFDDVGGLGRVLLTPGFGLTLTEELVRTQIESPSAAGIAHPFCVRCVQ